MFDKRPLRPDVIPSIQVARILIKTGLVEYRHLNPKNPEVRITEDGRDALKLLQKLLETEE